MVKFVSHKSYRYIDVVSGVCVCNLKVVIIIFK
jgi:hypothetical protein